MWKVMKFSFCNLIISIVKNSPHFYEVFVAVSFTGSLNERWKNERKRKKALSPMDRVTGDCVNEISKCFCVDVMFLVWHFSGDRMAMEVFRNESDESDNSGNGTVFEGTVFKWCREDTYLKELEILTINFILENSL